MTTILHWLPWVLVGLSCAALFWRALSRSDEPGKLALRWGATALISGGLLMLAARFLGFGSTGNRVADYGVAFLVAGSAAAGGIIIGLIWARQFGELLARPFTGLFDDGGNQITPSPLYSAAIAHRKQGRFPEAIAEIENQLQGFPNDLAGILMLAEIQAEDLHDLPAAESVLLTWLSATTRDRGEQAIVLTRLAHWHLHLAHDPPRARHYLEQITHAFPGTEAALLAEQRLAHLDFEAQPKAGPIRLPEGLGAPLDTGVPPPPPASDETAETAQLVTQLAAHPHDLAARERLAWLYGWSYQRADLARAEFETLLGFKNTSAREAAHWFNLLADLEIQIARDATAAAHALERLIARDPASAAAEQARHRIPFLSRELARHAPVRIVGHSQH